MIFKTQSLLTLKLDTGTNVTSATVKQILFKKPDGTTGQWNATLEGTTVLTYAVGNNDLDQDGYWEFQAYVEIGSLKGFGLIVREQVRLSII